MAEEREPIRIRNKTLTFEFERNKTWQKDLFGEQWKPTPADEEGTGGFTVEVTEPAPCYIPAAQEVRIDVMIPGHDDPQRFRIYAQRNFDPFSGAFLNTEPKLDSPVGLKAVESGKKLRFKEHKEVHITAIYADGKKADCYLPVDKPVVLQVRPNAEKPSGRFNVRLGLAAIALIGAGLAALFLQRRPGSRRGGPRQEERPPIRVRNKKLFFDHEKWQGDTTGRKWKPNDPQASPTSSYAVTLVTPPKSFPPFEAREVTLEVMIDAVVRPFRLFVEQAVPTLDAPVALEAINGRKRLKFKVDKEVSIARVLGDGAVKYEFASTEPQVLLDIQPLR